MCVLPKVLPIWSREGLHLRNFTNLRVYSKVLLIICRVPLERGWLAETILMYPTRSAWVVHYTNSVLSHLKPSNLPFHVLFWLIFSYMQTMLLGRMSRQWKLWLEKKHFLLRIWSLTSSLSDEYCFGSLISKNISQ